MRALSVMGMEVQATPQHDHSTLLRDLQAKYAVLEAKRDELKRDRDQLLECVKKMHNMLRTAAIIGYGRASHQRRASMSTERDAPTPETDNTDHWRVDQSPDGMLYEDAVSASFARALERRNAALAEALTHYAQCGDGCACGDGWDHTVALDALAANQEPL